MTEERVIRIEGVVQPEEVAPPTPVPEPEEVAEPTPTPVPTPPAADPLQERKEELESGLEYIRQYEAGEIEWRPEEFEAEVPPDLGRADIEAKLVVIEQQRQLESVVGEEGWTIEGQPITQEVVEEYRTRTLAAVSPFVTEGKLDLVAAIKSGIDVEQFKTLGVTDVDIQVAQTYVTKEKERWAVTGVAVRERREAEQALEAYPDVVSAILAGQVELVRKAGYDPSDIAKAQEFVSENVKLPDDTWVSREWYNSLPESLRSAADTAGFKGIEQALVSTETALQGYKGPDDSYDLVGAVRDEAVSRQDLVAFGFGDEDIDAAEEYAGEPFVARNPIENLTDEILRRYGADEAREILFHFTYLTRPESLRDTEPTFYRDMMDDPELLRMFEATLPTNYIPVDADMQPRAFTANYLAARGLPTSFPGEGTREEKDKWLLALHGSQLEYQRLYGFGAVAASVGIDALSLYFPPARALQPDVTIHDIGGAEWAIGAANIILLGGSSLLSKAVPTVAKALNIGAVGAIGAATALEWKRMSPAERVINISIIAVITGLVLRRPVLSVLRNVTGDVTLANRVRAVSNAVKTGEASKITTAAGRLEKYGESMKSAGRAGADTVIEQARYLKSNAAALAETAGRPIPDAPGAFQDVLDSLRRVGSEIRAGEAGRIQLRTAEEAREAVGIRRPPITEITPAWFEDSFSIWRTMGFSPDDLYELLRASGGDRALFERLLGEKLKYFQRMAALETAVNKERALKAAKRAATAEFGETAS